SVHGPAPILCTVKQRATPSEFMMNGFMPSAGAASSLMSGTSAPTHWVPFHSISLRFGSHGLPEGSHEARLYWMRRLAGHEKAQPVVLPNPRGSELSRRAIILPFSVQQPV